MVTSAEVVAGGALLGDALGGGVHALGQVHRAVADRVYDALPSAAAPVRAVHELVASSTYGTLRLAHRVIPRLGAHAASAFAGPERPALGTSPAGRLTLGTLNGLWGDRVERRYAALATPMTLSSGLAEIEVSAAGLGGAFPHASGRLAVFVHGLCETDRSWWFAAERHHGDPDVSYGSLLSRDLGFTPLYLRYNSGRCIADNARGLSDLLAELVAAWPVPVEEIVLVGHSMGGLVIRGACHLGAESNQAWTSAVRHVISLGTPHLGARLEQRVDVAAAALDRWPETRPAARVLEGRSAGVKDLRHGACVDDDAHGHDPSGFVRQRREEVPFLPHAAYSFVAASVLPDVDHPVAGWVGDLVVHLPSASGHDRDRRLPFPAENGARLGRLHHLDLLNHPAVYEQLRRWIG